MPETPKLKREIGLPLILFYGLGTIIGAGIYVLIGEVAGVAGMFAPIAFLVAALLAGLTAFSYAELVSRYPVSAGEAVYIEHGFSRAWLTRATGLAVVVIGSVSAATIANGFAGYFREFFDLPPALIVAGLVISLGLIAAWGVKESVSLAALITVLEVGGLVWIVWAARGELTTVSVRWTELLPMGDGLHWDGILFGALLAFYAFIGFEDMVNMSEEVREPQHNLPVAIAIVMVLTALIYGAIAIVAVLAVPPDILAESDAPLATIYRYTTHSEPHFISIISLLAVVNGALIQIIMAARVLFGMAKQGWVSATLSYVHPKTQTPLLATLLVTAIVLVWALCLPLVTLAEITGMLTLVVFSLVNLALILIKHRDAGLTVVPFQVPIFLPYLGFVVTTGFIVYQLLINFR